MMVRTGQVSAERADCAVTGAESSLMINIYMSHQLTSRTLLPLSSPGRDGGALAENGTFLEVFDD